MAGEGLYYTRAGSMRDRTFGGAQFMPVPQPKNLRTRDALFLTLTCPMPGLVGLQGNFLCWFLGFRVRKFGAPYVF